MKKIQELAIDILENEVEQNINDKMLMDVADQLKDICRNYEAAAEKIVEAGNKKNIKGAFSELRKEAEKTKSGNYGYVSPVDGFNIIMDYYGIIGICFEMVMSGTNAGASTATTKQNDKVLSIYDIL